MVRIDGPRVNEEDADLAQLSILPNLPAPEALEAQLEEVVLRALGALEVLQWQDSPIETRVEGAIEILKDLVNGNERR